MTKVFSPYFLFCVLLIVFVGCKKQKEQQKEETQKPNVLFILVDDLGLNDLSVTGSEYYETPNVDCIASEGAIFTQGYAASRVCSPSRASLMTGQFTARHGITDWIGAKTGTAWRDHGRHDQLLPAEYVHSLPKDDVSMAEAFKANGYKTFFSGKWHLGDEGNYPENHGFDINVGGWDKGSPMGGYFSPWNNPKLPIKKDGENLTMRLAQETADFIKQHKDTTFFAFLSFYAVHGPIETTKDKWKKYRDKAHEMGLSENGYKMERVLPIRQVQDNPIYAGLVESMDDAVGVVLESLKANGVDDNTIVVFTSDNGGVASGDAFSTSNLPLRGGKGYQWEGGIREPYFIKVPWLDQKGKHIDYPVTGADFYPTLLDLAGAELIPQQHVDGISLKPLLEGGEIASERPLYWHYPHYGNQGGNPSSIIRLGNWKLIHYWENEEEELYNLASDPSEAHNVINQHQDIAQKLSDQLLNWLKEVGAQLPAQDETYDANLAAQRYQKMVNEKMPALEKQRMDFLSENFQPNEDWWGSMITED